MPASPPAYLVLPLLSSIVYVFAARLFKQAGERGVDVWRTTFVSNLAGAALFGTLWWLGGPGQPWTQLWQPAVVALVLVAGQILAYISLTRGDISVATPLLGAKTVLVAFLSTLVLGATVPLRLWVGAALSTAAVALLSRSPNTPHHHAGITVATALGAASVFALFDVLVIKWSPAWGAGRFLPLMNALAALFSFALIPFFRAPLRAVPRATLLPLCVGSIAMGVQGVLLITTIALHGNATAVNIVYSARGLWSVCLVWIAGGWFARREQALGRRVLAWRLVGACLMTAAILSVLWPQ